MPDPAPGGAAFDLRLDASALTERLAERLEATAMSGEDEVFSTFLLAAGLYQIFEDYFHREAFFLKRAARLQSSAHSLVGSATRVAVIGAVIASGALRLTPRARTALRSAEVLRELVEQLARAAVNRGDQLAFEAARSAWVLLRPAVRSYPETLLRTVVRLPDSFYRFDQSLDDCRVLVQRLGERWPDRQRPVLVIGIRTSGSYLAPLYRALLLQSGYRAVKMMTVRPRQRWRRAEAAYVRTVTVRNGIVLLVDDPPASGAAVASVARDLERRGLPHTAVVVALPLFGPAASVPDAIRRYASVVLPWREWSIHEQLAPEAIERALRAMLEGTSITTTASSEFGVAAVRGVRRVGAAAVDGTSNGRRHVSSRYCVSLVGETGETVDQRIVVTGVGPSYFSERARALASALDPFVEAPLGISRGLIYEREAAPESRVRLPISRPLEEWLVSYIVQRRDALAVTVDSSLRTPDDEMVWRLVADALGKALAGPLRALVYPLTHAASRRLLEVSRPSVIDGNLSLPVWSMVGGRRDRPRKTDWLGRLSCYDAAFDLATVAASVDVEEFVLDVEDADEAPFGNRLLQTYGGQTGEAIDRERWLLYQLVDNHQRLTYLGRDLIPVPGRDVARAEAGEDLSMTVRQWLATRRALAKEYQRYISDVFFSDVEQPSAGPLCAFDVDWVLETRWLEFPALAPAGAVALRALLRHGYRPVIATARSLREVRDRCRMYRLAGGVAEFGSVVYDHHSARVLPQITASETSDLARLREELTKLPGVYLDHAHVYGVRAVRVREDGAVRGLEEETIRAAVDAGDLAGRVRVFRGGGQTDVVPVSVHKGTGLRTLATALRVDAGDKQPIAFAMGDDWPDAPMFDLARMRFAPANVSNELANEVWRWPDLTVTRDPYGSGVLQAVATFLGHDPHTCAVCAPVPLSERQRIMVTALAGLDGPRRRRVRQVAALAALLGASSLSRQRPRRVSRTPSA